MFRKLKTFRGRFRYDDRDRPFLEHLEEFRRTVIRALSVIIISTAICWPFVPWISTVLLAPAKEYIDSGKIMLQLPEVTSGFMTYLSLSFWGGVILSMPFLTFIIGSFIMPGVRDRERRIFQRISGFAGVLFMAGVWMGYRWTLPVAMKLMWGFNERLGGAAIWNYQKTVGFILQVLLGFGVAFQLPIIIILLGKLGFLESRQLREKRRHVIVGLFILAMFLTPPDPGTQILMAVPLILLYEFCIWFLYFSEGRKRGSTVSNKLKSGDAAPEVDEESL